MDRQRRNAIVTGLALAAMAVGIYAYIIVRFMAH
jgi:hypothetical protein